MGQKQLIGIRDRLIAGAAFVGLAAQAGASTAHAQSAVSPAPAERGTAASSTDIVVTAQRRSQDIQKVPIAVTALSPELIQNQSIQTLDEIQAVTPGLVFQTGYNFPQMYVRGIGVITNTPGLEQPVALYIDGGYVPRANGTLINLVDIGSIQILKGPQGTLYGRNATGGAILVTTADPTNKTSVSGQVDYGRFDARRIEAALNLPAGPTLSFRVAAGYVHEDGYVRNIATGNRILGHEGYLLRAKAKWEPAADFTAILSVEYEHDNARSKAGGRQVASAPFCVPCQFGVPNAPGFYQVNEDREEPNPLRDFSAHLNLSYKAGSVQLQSVTSYRDLTYSAGSDVDHSPLSLLAVSSAFGGKTFEQDFQASSDFGGPLDFLAGVAYIDDRGDSSQAIFGGAVGVPKDIPKSQQIYSEGDITTKTLAAFAEIYWRLADNFTLTLGGRYSNDRRSIVTLNTPLAQAVFNPGGPNPFGQKVSYNRFTPRIVAAYDAGPVNLYASYTRGFKAGGFTSPAYAPQAIPIKPETVDSYEIGAKFVSVDRKTRLNLAAFHYDYKDVQVGTVDVFSGGQIFTNAASARGNGVEAEFSHQAAEWLDLSLGLAYLDAKYRRYPNAPVFLVAIDPAGVPTGYVSGTEDLSGRSLPRSPKFSMTAGADLHFPVAGDWNIRLSPLVRHTSSYDLEPGAGGPDRNDRQRALTIVNLTGGIGPSDGKYEIGFYLENLTNKKYYNLIVTSAFGVETYVARPITYGARLKFKL